MVGARNVIFGKQTFMITRKRTRYTILTSRIYEGHLRSKQRSYGSIFKNTLRYQIFGIQTLIIPLYIIINTILTFEVIKGHRRSKKSEIEVKFRKYI